MDGEIHVAVERTITLTMRLTAKEAGKLYNAVRTLNKQLPEPWDALTSLQAALNEGLSTTYGYSNEFGGEL